MCRTSSSPLLKLNNTQIISPKPTSSNTNCDMILILVNRHTFNWWANAPTWFSKCVWSHTERQHGIAFLWALWFILSGQPTLYAMKRNLKNMLPLLFFNMFLFCYSVFSTYSMFLVRKGSRDICSQHLIELACTWSIRFQLVAAIQHRIFQPVPLSRFIYHGYGVPLYVHNNLPSCCVLLLSWFGNKLSIHYIMNLSSANYPYFWSLFFVCTCARLY